MFVPFSRATTQPCGFFRARESSLRLGCSGALELVNKDTISLSVLLCSPSSFCCTGFAKFFLLHGIKPWMSSRTLDASTTATTPSNLGLQQAALGDGGHCCEGHHGKAWAIWHKAGDRVYALSSMERHKFSLTESTQMVSYCV